MQFGIIPAQIFKKVTSGIKPASLAKVKDGRMKDFIQKCLVRASERLHAKKLLKDPFLQVENPKSSYAIPLAYLITPLPPGQLPLQLQLQHINPWTLMLIIVNISVGASHPSIIPCENVTLSECQVSDQVGFEMIDAFADSLGISVSNLHLKLYLVKIHGNMGYIVALGMKKQFLKIIAIFGCSSYSLETWN